MGSPEVYTNKPHPLSWACSLEGSHLQSQTAELAHNSGVSSPLHSLRCTVFVAAAIVGVEKTWLGPREPRDVVGVHLQVGRGS
jgi:hypothetical protein